MLDDLRDDVMDDAGLHLVDDADGEDADAAGDGAGGGPAAGPGRRETSQATRLAKLAIEEGAELYHDGDGRTYAEVVVGEHAELMPTKGGTFAKYLRRLYWERFKGAVGAEGLQGAVAVLESMAAFDGERIDTAVRVAERDGVVYLDLADDLWRVVEISADGWLVTERSPVKFRRAAGMLAIPTPTRGGSLAELRTVVNLPDDGLWALVLAWLAAALRPGWPCPILAVTGEQGSAKSTLCKMLRALIDPHTCDLRAEPKDVQALMIAANNSHVVAFDNLSGVPGWLSDALCRLATGGGFAARELYSDDAERLFSARRPALLNGIEDVASRADLLDRCICIHLPTIPDANRRPEAELWARFEAARPRILGALLDAVVVALRRLSSVKLDRLPRMADFARWAVAAEPGLCLPAGSIMRAYGESRDDAVEQCIEASVVGAPLLDLIRRSGLWQGSAAELLAALEQAMGDKAKRPHGWPKGARAMAGAVRRLAPNLRRVGVAVDFHKGTDKAAKRLIRLAVASSESTGNPSSEPADAGHGGVENGVSVGRLGQASDDATVRRAGNRPTNIGSGGGENRVSDASDDSDGLSGALSGGDADGDWGSV